VFRAPRSDQHINDDWLRRVIHKAIVDSGVSLAVGCLSALGGAEHAAALAALRAMSETASRRSKIPGVR